VSGGSYDYGHLHLADLAEEVQRRALGKKNWQTRLAFARLLSLCALAAHALEWVDSGDYAAGDEDAPILAALGSQAADIASSADKIRRAAEALVPELAGEEPRG